MPIHDYVCVECGHSMEVMHSVHGHGPAVCPNCGGAMKKVLAAPSVHYKGTGWARKERSGGASTGPRSSSQGGSKEAGASSSETSSNETTSTDKTTPAPAPTPSPTTESK